jgi:hypothetical protein
MEGSAASLRYYYGICREGLRKTTKNLSQDSRSPKRYSNTGLRECETGVSTSRPRRWILKAKFIILH